MIVFQMKIQIKTALLEQKNRLLIQMRKQMGAIPLSNNSSHAVDHTALQKL